ncbi:MAG: LLM class flavin-dependent oxidoreductase [Sphingomonadaceae bacterium]|nr:LLM class flavin-dependent oxidoreductase [Sphingomonadaceae bacterium]
MKHGVFVAPFHDMDRDPTLAIQRDLELMEWLDRLGFDEAWIGEHHSAGFETISSPELFIAAAAERTRRIRFGTGVVSLPYHNPLMVANRIVQLNHMTRGRVMFGVGPGLLASDAVMLGIDPAVQRDRMVQALDVILRLFAGEAVTEKTDWYELVDARLHLLPYSRPRPEVAVASAATPSGGRVAGQYGLSMLCVAAGVLAGFDALTTNWDIACAVAERDGRAMSRDNLRVVLPIHLAETREAAAAQCREGLTRYIDYMNNNMPRYKVPDGIDIVEWWTGGHYGVIGTPDDAIAAIRRLLDQQQGFGTFLAMPTNFADWPACRRSHELYADHVMPHFWDANRARRASYSWVTANQQELVTKRSDATRRMFDRHEAEEAARKAADRD